MLQNVKKCIIVDDDELSRTIIREFVGKTESLSLQFECDSAIAAADFLRNNDIDVVFLDVEMPYLSGMELLKSVKNMPDVILITAKENYAVEAFELEVKDYIVKPVSYARFLKAVNKVLLNSGVEAVENKNKLFVKSNGKFIGITYQDILFIEAMGDYISIVTTKQKYAVHSTLAGISTKIEVPRFFKVHRSFIVNLDHISSIEDNTIIIDGRIIPIGTNYKQSFFSLLGLT